MTPHSERRANPTLLGGQRRQTRDTRLDGGHVPSLVDLLHEGFYAMFLLRSGAMPLDDHEYPQAGKVTGHADADADADATIAGALGEGGGKAPSTDRIEPTTQSAASDEPEPTAFMRKVTAFLADFDREARKLQVPGEDIEAARYAFCATFDEAILSSSFQIRGAWGCQPLQLDVSPGQLAGNQFFDRLEVLRSTGGARLQALQVFHMCLLLGFRGRHMFDSSDKLSYITARLGDEIAHLKGKSRGFAPQAERPDQIVNKLRNEVPSWALSSVFGVLALTAYIGLETSLRHSTQDSLAPYADLIKLAPPPANVTITLP
jgi:type VI secretion system protein ImpK